MKGSVLTALEGTAIILATNEAYLNQALAMADQLEKYQLQDKAWVVPLEAMSSASMQKLESRFLNRVTAVLQLPIDMKLSGGKPFYPQMVPSHDHYILIDTDLLILDDSFFTSFAKNLGNTTTLVAEPCTCAEFLEISTWQRELFAHFPEVSSQPCLQTGVIGISHVNYACILGEIQAALDKIKITKGDLEAWNYVAWKKPELFQTVSPSSCLVLRPNGSGALSKLHLPDVSFQNGKVYYDLEMVSALHHTASSGQVARLEHYSSLFDKL